MSSGTSAILVYHIPQTRSERVVWLLEEMGMPYSIRRLSYRDRDMRKPEFLAINPFGMLPTVVVDGVCIRETGAIFEFLLGMQPTALAVNRSEVQYPEYLAWLHSAEATVMQPVVGFIMNTVVLPESERLAEVARRCAATWQDFLQIVNDTLAGRDFLCGTRFTAADILIGHVLRMANSSAMIAESFANARRYLAQLEQRPAYQRMLVA
jgi:glutathione S-transferase